VMASVLSQRCLTLSIAYLTPPTTGSRVRVRMASSNATGEVTQNSEPSPDTVVQYVVLRRDLIDTWPLGSVVTQGCHASVAAICSHKDDLLTQDYCSPSNLDSMHKASVISRPFVVFSLIAGNDMEILE
ncbi:unnamed protein product, partial [Ilex paraguariensis]